MDIKSPHLFYTSIERREIMKLTKGLEQAVCILAMLSTQDNYIPITSHVLNSRLKGTSHSYIRKIIRKLVVNGLATSVPGSNGGFTLAKKPENINLLEIVEALEGKTVTYPNSGMINQVFSDIGETASNGEKTLVTTFKEADKQYSNFLKHQTLDQLIWSTVGKKEIPAIDWNKK